MEDGESAEFWYAYHAYHTHGMTPSTFAELPRKNDDYCFYRYQSKRRRKTNEKK